MSKFVVCVFDSEEAAYAGLRALKSLHAEGSIALYAGAVIVRDSSGTVRVVDAADEGPKGTATLALTGALVGLIGGPVGVAIGTLAGSLGGLIYDLRKTGVDTRFVNDVSSLLVPGKSAVVADLTESWTVPLDTSIETLGGTVLRKRRVDVEDEQFVREVAASKQELEEFKADLKDASGDAKKRVQASIDRSKQKLISLTGEAESKLRATEDVARAKLATIDEAIAKSGGNAKAKLEKHRDEIKADLEMRRAKLKQAGVIIREALA